MISFYWEDILNHFFGGKGKNITMEWMGDMGRCSKRPSDAWEMGQEDEWAWFQIISVSKGCVPLPPPLTSSTDCLSPAEVLELPFGLSFVLLSKREAMLKFATNREYKAIPPKDQTGEWRQQPQSHPSTLTFLKGAASITGPRVAPPNGTPPALHLQVWVSEPFLWIVSAILQAVLFLLEAQNPGSVAAIDTWS